MKLKKLLPFTLAFVLAGCIPVWSLHPLYDDKHVAFEEKLLGTFTDEKEDTKITWEFTQAKDPNTYQLIYSSTLKGEPNGMKGLFDAHLVKLDGGLFMDIYPKDDENNNDLNQMKWMINLFLVVPVHTFAKVEILDSQLNIYLTDDDELKKLLKDEPGAVKYEQTEEGKLVLTASTRQLQEFVLKHADDNRLFTNKHTLIRRTVDTGAGKTKTTEADVNNISSDANEIPH